MKLFLDTNVIVDFLSAREPWAVEAAKIFRAAETHKVYLTTSSISVANCMFMLRSRYKMINSSEVISLTLDYLEVISSNTKVFKTALQSHFSDKEDAVQHYTALEHGNVDYIITRDIKGFAKSEIPVLTPYEFVSKHLKK